MSKKPKKSRQPNVGLSDKDEIAKVIADITAERQAASSQLSTQSRTIALGVLAVAWVLLGGTQQPLAAKFAAFDEQLIWIAAVCVVSLVADFLQYSSTLIETNRALDDSENAVKADEAGYDDPSWLRSITNAFFLMKLAASLLAAGWLLSIIYLALTAD